jgi:hypothetical protein
MQNRLHILSPTHSSVHDSLVKPRNDTFFPLAGCDNTSAGLEGKTEGFKEITWLHNVQFSNTESCGGQDADRTYASGPYLRGGGGGRGREGALH